MCAQDYFAGFECDAATISIPAVPSRGLDPDEPSLL